MTIPQPAAIPLQPLSVGQVFQASFSIYGRNFAQFLVLGLIPSGIGLVIGAVMIALMLTSVVPMITGYGYPQFSVFAIIGAVLVSLVGTWLITAATYTCTALTARGTVEVNRGQSPTIGSLWRGAPGLFGQTIVLTLIYLAAAVALSLVMLILIVAVVRFDLPVLLLPIFALGVAAVVIFVARFGIILSVLGIEQLSATATIKRCWQLTVGAAARIFGYLILAGLMIGLATQLVSSVFQVAAGPLVENLINQTTAGQDYGLLSAAMVLGLIFSLVASQVLGAIATPFSAIYNAVVYIDQRRRTEALTGQPLFG